uniref:Uncharacterized protein n=1 Tax=Romanomermis culicivorax TaxID=13658 RepID=A0A915I5S6_ROMCU
MYKIPSRANKLVVKSRTFQREFHQNVSRNDDKCSSPNDSNSKGSSVSSGSRTESPDSFCLNHDNKIIKSNHHHNGHYHHSRSNNNTNNRHIRRHRSDLAMISFVQAGWNQVMMEYQSSLKQESPSVVYYKPKMENSSIKDFKPIDLETWYVQRMLKNMNLDTAVTSLVENDRVIYHFLVYFVLMTKQHDKKKNVKKSVSPKKKLPQMKWHKRSLQDENTSILHASLSRQSGREKRSAAEQTTVPSYHPNVSAVVGVSAVPASKTGDHISLVSRSHDRKTSSTTDSKSGSQKSKPKSGACVCKSIFCVLLIIVAISAVVGVVIFRKKIRLFSFGFGGVAHNGTSRGIPHPSKSSMKIPPNATSLDDYNISDHAVSLSTTNVANISPHTISNLTTVSIQSLISTMNNTSPTMQASTSTMVVNLTVKNDTTVNLKIGMISPTVTRETTSA